MDLELVHIELYRICLNIPTRILILTKIKTWKSVLRIHNILGRTRIRILIRGSMPLTSVVEP
jgi:hypothetical protein